MDGELVPQSDQRALPQSIAGLVAEWEMFGLRIVTVADVAQILGVAASSRQVERAVRNLVSHRWIRPLTARGSYEFLAASGGPYGSGDPLVEARAVSLRRPGLLLQVVGDGAAFLRGYADRAPATYGIAVDKAATRSRALERAYVVIRTTHKRLFGAPELDGVPVSDATRLLVDLALWLEAAGDLRDADHWLARALRDADPRSAADAVDLIGTAAAARMAYLADRFGASDIAASVRDRMGGRRARTSIGPASEKLHGRDARLGVDDRVGVARAR